MSFEPPERWLTVTADGLTCVPGGFVIDPVRPVAKAVITHGHGDHARAGHQSVLATAETLAIMDVRLGTRSGEALAHGEVRTINGVKVSLHPAGHVLGSAQVRLEHGGCRVVVSGDYKRRRDPTCAPFEVVPCDLFITEATFGLPVFRHPPDEAELGRLLHSLRVFPDRAHLVGAYALGKAQRVIARLRELGYDRPIHIHGALQPLCDLYERFGVALGELRPASRLSKEDSRGAVILCPPSALADRWSRRFADPLTALASGWMRVRARARQRGVELPLIISDHADWDELTATLADVDAPRIWVTHGREEALVHHARGQGRDAVALSLVGYEEDAA